jgi:hypothetical protein
MSLYQWLIYLLVKNIMSKIKKLWKLLAGSISWNLKAPENSSEIIKPGKKQRHKNVHSEDVKRMAES